MPGQLVVRGLSPRSARNDHTLGQPYAAGVEAEWLTIAQNVLSVPSNWSGGAVGSGYIYSGHNDSSPANALAAGADSDGYNGTGNTSPSNQRRTLTLTNGAVIWDLAGDAWEWTDGTVAGGQQPGLSGEPGYAWKDWNTAALIRNGLSASALPSYGTPAANGWTSAQGIGRLYSYVDSAILRGFVRGGNAGTGSPAGVLALDLSTASGSTSANVGFRVSR